MQTEYLGNGKPAHVRAKEIQDALSTGLRKIRNHPGRVQAVIVGCMLTDGTIIIEGAGPASAVEQIGMTIVQQAQK